MARPVVALELARLLADSDPELGEKDVSYSVLASTIAGTRGLESELFITRRLNSIVES
jgi:hypothetical protein